MFDKSIHNYESTPIFCRHANDNYLNSLHVINILIRQIDEFIRIEFPSFADLARQIPSSEHIRDDDDTFATDSANSERCGVADLCSSIQGIAQIGVRT